MRPGVSGKVLSAFNVAKKLKDILRRYQSAILTAPSTGKLGVPMLEISVLENIADSLRVLRKEEC